MINDIYFLKGFNNYFNRKLRYYSTLNDYLSNAVDYTTINDCYNFNPNDGISTTQIVDNAGDGDYCVVVDGDTTSQTYNQIISRWFVMDYKRTHQGQWEATLYRDVKAEEFSHWKTAPAFVEKGNVLNADDPAIYNKEQVTVNQIKTAEYLLKDESLCPWLVGYIKKGQGGSGSFDSVGVYDYNAGTKNIEDWLYDEYSLELNKRYWRSSSTTSIAYRLGDGPSYTEARKYKFTTGTSEFEYERLYDQTTDYPVQRSISWQSTKSAFTAQIGTSAMNTAISSARNKYTSDSKYLLAQRLNGKIIKTTETSGIRYIRLEVRTTSAGEDNYFEYTSNSNLRDALKQVAINANVVNTWTSYSAANTDALEVTISGNTNVALFALDITSFINTNWTVETNRLPTADQVYDCIAIPYGEVRMIHLSDNVPDFTTVKEVGLQAAYSICATLTQEKCIDFQILPFCPCPQLLNGDEQGIPVIDMNKVTATGKHSSPLYSQPGGTGDKTYNQCIIYLSSSQLTTNLEYIYDGDDAISIADSGIFTASSISEKKIKTQCDMYRLCSPNWNGQFEFDPMKMGTVTLFNVDMALIPYNPYIHVNPVWSGLYGQDYNGPRGLICAGDFSLSQDSDRWEEYAINNKNYENQFQRQIENMEFNNKWQKAQSIVGAIGGTVQGAAYGSMLSGGNPIGTIAGGVASGAAGVMDVVQTIQTQKETMDYTRDMHAMSLENIKALPNNITKVSSINNNNKIFVVLEYYTCTTEERTAVSNKILYNGMTINRIGTFNEFIDANATQYSQYVKGQIIRMDWLNEDNHYATTLNQELNMGVFI